MAARDADTVHALEAAGCLPVVMWQHEEVAVAAARIYRLDTSRRGLTADRVSA